MKAMSNAVKKNAIYYSCIKDHLQNKPFKIMRKSDLLPSGWNWLKTQFNIVDDQDIDFYKIKTLN